MAQFRYKAVGIRGEISQGVMEAQDRAEVIAHIQSLGHVPIRAEEYTETWISAFWPQQTRRGGRIAPRVLIGLFRQIETLLRAGVPLDRALDLLQRQADSEADAATFRALVERVRRGESLSQAMSAENKYPEFCVSIIRAGEAGGALETNLGQLAEQLEKTLKATERFQSALLYPAIVTIACGLSFAFLFTFIVPRFKVFFENTDAPIPAITRAVLWTGSFFENYGALVALITGAVAWLLVLYLRVPRHRERWSARILSVPFIGSLILKTETGRFCRVLGTLLKNGVSMTRSLEIAGGTFRNPVLAAAVRAAAEDVKGGKGLYITLLRTGVFPRYALQLLRIGEEAARLDGMLIDIADAYDRETERDIDRLLALLGPALTIVLGILVALVIGSILVALLGVYQLTL